MTAIVAQEQWPNAKKRVKLGSGWANQSAMLDTSKFLVGVTVGSGGVAAVATRSGADFLLAINAARLRNMGAPSIACLLPLADAVSLVDDYAASEVLPIVTKPVFVGLTCWRSGFDARAQTQRLMQEGFSGVVNFPTSGMYPTEIQRKLERAGVGFSAEMEMLMQAQRAGAMALAYCYSISQCRQAALAGVRHILLNLGFNIGGVTSPTSDLSLEEAAALTVSATKQIRRIHPGAVVLLEGGPIESSNDLAFVRERAKLDGYVGGSTFERLPVEQAIADRIATFKAADRLSQTVAERHRGVVAAGEKAGFVVKSPAMKDALLDLIGAADSRRTMSFVTVPNGESFRPVERLILSRTPPSSTWVDLDVQSEAEIERLLMPLLMPGRRPLPHRGRGAQLTVVGIRSAELLSDNMKSLISNLVLDAGDPEMTHRICLFCLSHKDPSLLSGDDTGVPFERLCRAHNVHLPPLRSRPEDIPFLIDQVLAHTRPKASHLVSPGAMRRLQSHAWYGNSAELVEVCSRLEPMMAKGLIGSQQVEQVLLNPSSKAVRQTSATEEERQILISALANNRFRKAQTADALGISRKTLYNRMKRFGLS